MVYPMGAGCLRLMLAEKSYVNLYDPTHPLAVGVGVVGEHRAVLYSLIGPGVHPCHWCKKSVVWGKRCAGGTLMVDHLDGNQKNNDPSNLVPSCHGCNVMRGRPGHTVPDDARHQYTRRGKPFGASCLGQAGFALIGAMPFILAALLLVGLYCVFHAKSTVEVGSVLRCRVSFPEHILVGHGGFDPQLRLSSTDIPNDRIVIVGIERTGGWSDVIVGSNDRAWSFVWFVGRLCRNAFDQWSQTPVDIASASRAIVFPNDGHLGIQRKCIDRHVRRRAWRRGWLDPNRGDENIGPLSQVDRIALMREGNVGYPPTKTSDHDQYPVRPDRRLFAFPPIAFGFVLGALYGFYVLTNRFKLFGERLDLLFICLVAYGIALVGFVGFLAAYLRLGVG